jgi:hypothetical protein
VKILECSYIIVALVSGMIGIDMLALTHGVIVEAEGCERLSIISIVGIVVLNFLRGLSIT